MRLEGVAIIPTCEECEATWHRLTTSPGRPTTPTTSRRKSRSIARSALHGSLAPTDRLPAFAWVAALVVSRQPPVAPLSGGARRPHDGATRSANRRRSRRQLDEAFAERDRDRLRARAHAQLAEDVLDVRADRSGADEEL
jgi:hypothetical protein